MSPASTNEGDLVVDCGFDEVLGGSTRGPANLLSGSALIGGEATEGAIDVQIGGVQDLHGVTPGRVRTS
jgi:hypothetical protein